MKSMSYECNDANGNDNLMKIMILRPEAYLEPSRTSTMEFFREIS